MIKSQKLVQTVEDRRREVNASLDPETRAQWGQFMTPTAVASVLAESISMDVPELRLLDPGAGVGSLTASVVARLLESSHRPKRVTLTAYEIDPAMCAPLADTLDDCREALSSVGVEVETKLLAEDFIDSVLKGTHSADYTAAILNPPFMKMNARGETATQLRARGWSAANLYAAFWCAAIENVVPGGDVVAITPRSFCNGSYFAGFRRYLLEETALTAIHVFDARDKAFSEDGVLQETVVTHSVRHGQPGAVRLAVSHEPNAVALQRTVDIKDVVHPEDPGAFIRLPVDAEAETVREWMGRLEHSLDDLGIAVSTGPVVDFRARDHLKAEGEEEGTVPLFYPTHMVAAGITWPRLGRKPNGFVREGAEKLLTADGAYTFVKRFSAKEEPRRVVAAYYDGSLGKSSGGGHSAIALENHLNYFHEKGAPLPHWLAQGLTVFLNSTMVDRYFRQFNGHTQVNAGDLRSLRYPSHEQLRILGKSWRRGMSQAEVDDAVEAL